MAVLLARLSLLLTVADAFTLGVAPQARPAVARTARLVATAPDTIEAVERPATDVHLAYEVVQVSHLHKPGQSNASRISYPSCISICAREWMCQGRA